MSLQGKINEELKAALKAKNEEKVSVLRLLLSAVTNRTIEKGAEKGKELEDAEVIKIIKSQIKQLKDAMVDFEKGGRDDLSLKNKKEIDLLSVYLPEEMSEKDIKKSIKEEIEKIGEVTAQDFGRIMGATMKKVGDRADGDTVKRLVQEILNQ